MLKGGWLNKSKMSLDDVWKLEVTEIHGYWQVMNSKLYDWKTKKYENQMLPILLLINVKTYQFKTQCKGDISHAFETAKITVFDPVGCKTPDAPLQNELLYWTFVVYADNWRE